MQNKLQQKYETRLETAGAENISAILDAKLEATSAERVVDYVSFGIDNLQSSIDRIKQAEADLKALKADTQQQIDIIKSGASKWLTESGVEKLTGDIVSSMKVTNPKSKEELIVINEESLINAGYFKQVLDKTAVKNAILAGDIIEGATIEVTHQEDSLTIYKKKSATKS